MTDHPIYRQMFEYMDTHYEFRSIDNPLTRYYKYEIVEKQYPNLDGPVGSEMQPFRNPDEAGILIRDFARAIGADLVGFTRVMPDMIFSDASVKHRFAVVLAMEMDHDLTALSPELIAGVETLRVYWRLGDIVVRTAAFIRSLGYSALAHHPRSDVEKPPTIMHTAAAIHAGLGECGLLGILITEEFGPRVRLATVTTDLELPYDTPKSFGVQEFCTTCHKCVDACQGKAISGSTVTTDGITGQLKYIIDPYKCAPLFAEHDGCNLCVASCAFNRRPGEEMRRFVEKIRKPAP